MPALRSTILFKRHAVNLPLVQHHQRLAQVLRTIARSAHDLRLRHCLLSARGLLLRIGRPVRRRNERRRVGRRKQYRPTDSIACMNRFLASSPHGDTSQPSPSSASVSFCAFERSVYPGAVTSVYLSDRLVSTMNLRQADTLGTETSSFLIEELQELDHRLRMLCKDGPAFVCVNLVDSSSKSRARLCSGNSEDITFLLKLLDFYSRHKPCGGIVLARFTHEHLRFFLNCLCRFRGDSLP